MTFDYDACAAAGFETVVIEYGGSNDEGWIHQIYPSPFPEGEAFSGELYEQLEQEAYDVLEQKYPGWEINEGSDGTITLDVKARKAVIHHGSHYEQTDWSEEEV